MPVLEFLLKMETLKVGTSSTGPISKSPLREALFLRTTVCSPHQDRDLKVFRLGEREGEGGICYLYTILFLITLPRALNNILLIFALGSERNRTMLF